MVTGANGDPKCGDPSFIKFAKEMFLLLLFFCADAGTPRQKVKLTTTIETKIKDKTNRLEHKLVASASSYCMYKMFWTNELKIVIAINDKPSLVFTAAFLKMIKLQS